MGQIITKVKITLDYAGKLDTHYNRLTVAFNGTKSDLHNTVVKFLKDQHKLGLIPDKDLRNARLEDDTDTKDGIFGNFIEDIKNVLR